MPTTATTPSAFGAAARPLRETAPRQPCRLLVDDRQHPAVRGRPGTDPRRRERRFGQCGFVYEIKAGRRGVNLPPRELRAALRRNAVEEPAVHPRPCGVCRPWERPWDRLLAARALLENRILVSVDKVFDGIPIERRW